MKQNNKDCFMLLLNEGKGDQQTISLTDYINVFDEDFEADFLPVINLNIGQKIQYGADEIKRVETATVNNEEGQKVSQYERYIEYADCCVESGNMPLHFVQWREENKLPHL